MKIDNDVNPEIRLVASESLTYSASAATDETDKYDLLVTFEENHNLGVNDLITFNDTEINI